MEGFETFGSSGRTGPALIADLEDKYHSDSSLNTGGQLVTGRNGGLAYEFGDYQDELVLELDDQGTWIIGFAYKHQNGSGQLVQLQDDTGMSPQCELYVNTDDRLEVRSSSTVRGTGSTVLGVGQWYYIEWKIEIGDSADTEVRVNGATDIDLAGVDTQQQAGVSTANRIVFSALSSAGDCLDDIYVCDGTGSSHNDFLGEVEIEAIFPSSDYGTCDWTCSTGTDHYALIDDNPPDADSTYISTDTVDHKDLFDYEDVSGDAGILGLQINTLARIESAARNLTPMVRSAGTEYDQTAQSVTGMSYRDFVTILESDPATSSAWTVANLNAAQFGVKMTA
jgi:hypothetical protein